jgi:pimeloyl-ACP methyl ester carboxylesterase
VPDQARQVARALDALHVRGATVAGHSMGGDVGVQLAASRPELVDRLVLLDTPTSAGGVHGSLLVRSSLWPVIGPLVNVWAPDPLKRLGAAIAVAPGAHVPADMVRDVDRMRWPAYQGSFDATMAWVADEAVDRRLRALDVPVLVVWGDRDQLADPGMADRYRRLPGAQVVMLHGVGHTPPVEAPEATAALLAAFSASEPVPR